MIRPLFLFGGGVMLALGIAGTILPLLPTTPFLLVATAVLALIPTHRTLAEGPSRAGGSTA